MRRLRVKAGIGPDENGEMIVMYTNRHTFGTGASANGVVDRKLADLMGHTDTKTTQKYIHLANPELQNAVRDATKNYLGVNQNGDSSS
jgi:site-specific recombinase XerD